MHIIFKTDIDPGSASIDAVPGYSFRKPSPGSTDDSKYVHSYVQFFKSGL